MPDALATTMAVPSATRCGQSVAPDAGVGQEFHDSREDRCGDQNQRQSTGQRVTLHETGPAEGRRISRIERRSTHPPQQHPSGIAGLPRSNRAAHA